MDKLGEQTGKCSILPYSVLLRSYLPPFAVSRGMFYHYCDCPCADYLGITASVSRRVKKGNLNWVDWPEMHTDRGFIHHSGDDIGEQQEQTTLWPSCSRRVPTPPSCLPSNTWAVSGILTKITLQHALCRRNLLWLYFSNWFMVLAWTSPRGTNRVCLVLCGETHLSSTAASSPSKRTPRL